MMAAIGAKSGCGWPKRARASSQDSAAATVAAAASGSAARSRPRIRPSIVHRAIAASVSLAGIGAIDAYR